MIALVGMFVGGFSVGMLVGLIFGPDSEREDVAKVDGWLAGYQFARSRSPLKDNSNGR